MFWGWRLGEYSKLLRVFGEAVTEESVCDLKLEGREGRKIGRCKNNPMM